MLDSFLAPGVQSVVTVRRTGALKGAGMGKIAAALGTLDSHSVYDMAFVTKLLRDAGYIGPMPSGFTDKQIGNQIKARGLGGSWSEAEYPDQRFIAGFQLAPWVARKLDADTSLGDRMHGRGSAFRAYVQAIEDAE